MVNNSDSTSSSTLPGTAWLARGRHLGPEPERDVRRNLIALKAAGVIDDFLDLDPVEAARSTDLYPRGESADPGPLARRLFEARWRVADEVTVRAQLTTYDPASRRAEGEGVLWVLAAEAERSWAADWPSPATVFWPDTDQVAWDHDTVAELRLRTPNHLPQDDGELRRLLRECARQSWFVHVVVHEAMTPDALGRRPLTAFLPPSLRHRVVEHRATPEQALIADFAIKRELGVGIPRGGAVVLPGDPRADGYEAERFTVRNVFLDGTEPSELIAAIVACAALPRPLSAEAERALARLREGWHLYTQEEELVHARAMVTHYATALASMTASCDLYREAAESALAALADVNGSAAGTGVPVRPGALSEPGEAGVPGTPGRPGVPGASGLPGAPTTAPTTGPKQDSSPLKALSRTFARFRSPNE
ncbi:collagen-like protein [Streptomyces sp. NPDC048659]|uniref:collagen-like protein n=1 Tax=Streptomyces sp. NPDC048659 TaxID=3155489 RepID=UPI003427A762